LIASLASDSPSPDCLTAKNYRETETKQSGKQGGVGKSAESAPARANTIAASKRSLFVMFAELSFFICENESADSGVQSKVQNPEKGKKRKGFRESEHFKFSEAKFAADSHGAELGV
jgi:hypothetical protein